MQNIHSLFEPITPMEDLTTRALRSALDLLLKPVRITYTVLDLPYPHLRKDFTVRGSSSQQLHASLYQQGSPKGLVVYVHGNSSCRLQANSIVGYTLREGLGLLCYDQNACGHSDGRQQSMGINEADDLACVVAHARKAFGFVRVYLWGRSMGAFTAIRYLGIHQPAVQSAVIDSSFSDLRQLILEVAKSKAYAPYFILEPLVELLFKEHRTRSGVDLACCEAVEAVRKIGLTDLLFLCSEEDGLIDCKHSERLFEAAISPCKQLVKIPGSHVAARSKQTLDLCFRFLAKRLTKRPINIARSKSRSPEKLIKSDSEMGQTMRCRFSSPQKVTVVERLSRMPITVSCNKEDKK